MDRDVLTSWLVSTGGGGELGPIVLPESEQKYHLESRGSFHSIRRGPTTACVDFPLMVEGGSESVF